ncbi:hypothetical protein X739_00615 [Mesorhizobium sp. LNHC220B00]|nr:hypothetical protein [Mesorhizobium sp. LNHC220B00]ESY89033.1 hypothetical protein X739_00615 [Mesorhizobium sp. LNHC220B00]
MNKPMQCKDIADLPILRFVASHEGRRCNWYFGDERDVRQAMPNGFDLPDKLVIAKMAGLIRRKLLDGCPCGCRGDYEITVAGEKYIATDGRAA